METFESFSTKKSNTEDFIKRSKIKHGNVYDYSMVEYKNNNTKVKIICQMHGVFEQIPRSHISGNGCYKCGKGTSNKSNFEEKSILKHGNKYDYSQVNDENFQNTKKVQVICPTHGPFFIDPKRHLKGVGCSGCSGNRKLTTNEFIGLSKEKYSKYNYNYDKTIYNGYDKYCTITCPKHGDFLVNPSLHLNGVSHCKGCSDRKIWNFEHFLNSAKEIHGDKYKYDINSFKNSTTKTKITCIKHGDFYQSPESHIRQKSGCNICRESKGESAVFKFLTKHNIKFERYKKFDDCKHIHKLVFDFFLPEVNICIEFDGVQHSEPRDHFGGETEFENTKIRDKIKNEYCDEKNIKLIRISKINDIEIKLNFLCQ